MAVDGSLKFDTKIDTEGFKQGTNTIKNQTNGLKSVITSLGKTIAVVFGVTKLIQFGKQAIETASDLEEVQNVVDTAFGSMTYKMEEFAAKSIEAYGISKLVAKQTGSTFMAMARGMNIAVGEASDMAIALTGLSADMASFYNINQDIASTALNSIFTGETETLKRFGIVMTEVNLEAFALSKGINKSVRDMAQAEKVQLRYAYVMEQTALAQGDFTRTSDSWANQTRVMKEQWKEFLGILGTGLIQVLTPIVKYLSSALTYLIQFANTVGRVLSSVFNLNNSISDTVKNTSQIATNSEDASSGLSEFGDAAEEANKKASGVSGIDQLNNITESVADNAENAADGLAAMGTGGGQYGMEITPTVNPADTSTFEKGLSSTIENIKTGLSTFIAYIQTSFAPAFSQIWTNLQGPIQNFKIIFAGVFGDIQSLVQPFLTFFTGVYVPYLQQAVSTIGVILVGLFDTFNKVFSDIWNIAVFPIIDKFITVILPMITDFSAQMWKVFEVTFTEIKRIFDMIWSDAIAPALEIATGIWLDFVDLLADAWNKWGKPIFDNIRTAIQKTADLFVSLWNSYLKPIWDTIMKVVDKLWTDHLKPLLANIMDFVGELVNGALEIYNKFIAPIVKWFIEHLGPPVAKVVSWLIKNFGEWLGNMIDVVSGVITLLKGIIQFISGVFTGDWKKAWQGVKNIFKGIWDSLVNVVKSPVNLIIDLINGLVSGVVSGLNAVIKAVNKISVKIPEWVPGFGGKTLGFNLNTITAPKIPRLATGTVVPANYGEFMAILGDNKRETEVVSPLSTMKKAMKEVLAEMGGASGGEYTFIAQLEGKTIFKETIRQDQMHKKSTGKSAFAPA